MQMRNIVLSLALCAPVLMIYGQERADTSTLITRSVVYRGAQGEMVLRPSFLFPRADPHFEFFVRKDRLQPVVNEGRVHVAEATPSLAVQGFGPGTDWVLVKLERHDGVDMLRVPSYSRWGDHFFSDAAFARDDMVPVLQSGNADVYTIRPAAPLEAGAYILCGRPSVDQGGWGRVCYDFEVGGGS